MNYQKQHRLTVLFPQSSLQYWSCFIFDKFTSSILQHCVGTYCMCVGFTEAEWYTGHVYLWKRNSIELDLLFSELQRYDGISAVWCHICTLLWFLSSSSQCKISQVLFLSQKVFPWGFVLWEYYHLYPRCCKNCHVSTLILIPIIMQRTKNNRLYL